MSVMPEKCDHTQTRRFTDVSPEILLGQTAPMDVTLTIGNAPQTAMPLTIPAPTKSELKTAKSLHKMTAAKRQALIRTAIEKNNLWTAAYMCAAQRREKLFDPDFKYVPTIRADRSLLALACHDGTPEGVGLLLQCGGININNGSGNYQYTSPLWGALKRKDEDNRDKIITMLCCYKNFCISLNHVRDAATKSMRDLLSHTMKRNKDYQPHAQQRKALTASAEDDARQKDAVPFTSLLSSDDLLAQTSPISAAFTIGDDKKTWIFNIPAPRAADVQMAQKAHDMTTEKRQKLIRKATETKNTWLSAYLYTVWREKDADLSWFDPNHYYSFELAASRSLPYTTVQNGNSAITAMMLQCSEIRLNYDGGNSHFPLLAALKHKDETHGTAAIEMLCCFHSLSISDYHVMEARTQRLHDLLKQTQLRNNAKAARDNNTEEEAAETEKPARQRKALTQSAAQDTETVWEKIDNATICKLSLSENTAYRLRRVFNFKSGTLSEVHEYLNEDGQVQTAAAQNLVPFNRLGSRREVEEAQTQLKTLNAARL